MDTQISSFQERGNQPRANDVRGEERPRIVACPICECRRLHYAFSQHGYRVERCADCGFLLLNSQPSDLELAAIYSETYFLDGESAERRRQVSEMKRATARLYLTDIGLYRGAVGGDLLEIGCGHGDLLLEAQQLGYRVSGVEISESAVQTARERVPGARVICGNLEDAGLPPGSFDVCVLCDVIEHVRQPVEFLKTVQSLLKPDGVLFIATPSLDSWSARLLRKQWMEFKPEHLSYFDGVSMQNALFRAGYKEVIVRPGRKVLNLRYIAQHFTRYPVPVVTPLVKTVARFTPRVLREWNIPIVASGMGVFAHAAAVSARPKLSVIVPAFNEAATFDTLMQALLAKELPGTDIEVVIVESNSSDGTREMARRFSGHPRVRLVLEDKPRGKGHAVRTGLQHATGEFILIQDADLEYDLDDYDALIEPLRRGRLAFVLGSRHGGNAFKMRSFANQWMLSTFLNLGHLFFTTLINVLFGLGAKVWLKDPFTMFKVFRRDCLTGLTFQCNRFDFDYELLIKLVRKGYRPVEIPVNYRSRSFKEGKKVSVFRDPLTWLVALARLRVVKIDPFQEISRQHQHRQGCENSMLNKAA